MKKLVIDCAQSAEPQVTDMTAEEIAAAEALRAAEEFLPPPPPTLEERLAALEAELAILRGQ